MSATRLRTGSTLRDNIATLLVTGVSALFGTVLIEATALLAGAIGASKAASSSASVAVALGTVSTVFLLLAVYVAAVVTANTFATVVAGRRRAIALLRVIGAESAKVRVSLAAEGLLVGAIGAVAGLIVGALMALLVTGAGVAQGWLPRAHYELFSPWLIAPVAMVILTTWLAAWVGCRTVTVVSPLEATAAASDPASAPPRARRKAAASIVLLAVGFLLLALGVLVGTALGPIGLFVAFIGGVLSFSGVIAGAGRILPPMLALVGRTLGRSPSSRIAVANAARYPERSTRATLALVIGVTLITTFAVALTSYSQVLDRVGLAADEQAGTENAVAVSIGVFSTLVGFSALIAAVGLVNTLTVGTLQRRRELGLLRALGFTRGQLRAMILAEGVQLTAGAVVSGLVLGTVYGWAAAQSLPADSWAAGYRRRCPGLC